MINILIATSSLNSGMTETYNKMPHNKYSFNKGFKVKVVITGNHYIPKKRKFSGILCFRQHRVSSVRRVHRVRRVRRVTISSLMIDIVVPSKMAVGGHFVKKRKKKKVAYRSEMARNVIESYFRTSTI